jgi:LacI family transcriptional regulator
MARNDSSKQGGHTKDTGIKDIATALGVSIGTVDRALHERPGINSETRARVLKMAQRLGYRPNVAARHLKLRRKLQIFVNLPKEIASFFDALRAGIQEAARPFQSTVEIQFRTSPRLGEHDVELLAEAVEAGANGIILAPGHPADFKPWIYKAVQKNVPVVCVATDAPGSEQLTTISSDPFVSGAMAAELLTRFSPSCGPGLIVTGSLSTVDHAEKIRGFKEFLKCSSSVTEIASVIEAHDDADEALRLTRACLKRHPRIDAIYVCTANSVPVIRAIEKEGRGGQVAVITTDLFPALVPFIRSGKVLATIYQRPRAQGRMAFQALYEFLVEGTCPPLRHRLSPHIILASNLDLFLEMLPGDFGEVVTPRNEHRKMPSKRIISA